MGMGGLMVTRLKFASHILDAVALVGEQDDEVIEDICTLVDEVLIVASGGTNDAFDGFLAQFLGNFVGAFFKEAGGVATLRHLLMSFVDEVLEFFEEHDVVGLVGLSPAGVGAGVAYGAVGVNLYEKRVVVAIFGYGDDVEEIATGLALSPKLLAATAEERHDALVLGFFESFLVHVAEHEDFASVIVLDDCGDESGGVFGEIHFRLWCEDSLST